MTLNQIAVSRRVGAFALTGLALSLSSFAPVFAADAKDKDKEKDKKTLTYTARTQEQNIGIPKCQGSTCLLPFNDFVFVDGDLSGSSIGSGTVSFLSPGKGYAVRFGYFTGTLKGCPGPGTAMAVTVSRIDAPNPTTGNVMFLEGSGTGGLSGISGTFTVSTDPAPGSPSIATGTGGCRS